MTNLPAPRYTMSWKPGAVSVPSVRLSSVPRRMGQRDFLQHPMASFLSSAAVAVGSAFLGWSSSKWGGGWAKSSTYWYVIATAAGIKALHDMSRM